MNKPAFYKIFCRLFYIVTLFCAVPSMTYAEGQGDERITLEMNDVTLREVMDAIKQQSRYLFVNQGVDETRTVSIPVRSNVDYAVEYSDEWLTGSISGTSSPDADGLSSSTLILNIASSRATRTGSVAFTYDGKDMAELSVKQKNPDAVYADFPDPKLGTALEKAGWVIEDEDEGRFEILEPGLVSTELTLGEGKMALSIGEISGLGVFPKLEKLTLNYVTATKVDISDCANITSLSMSRTNSLSEIIVGDNPMETLSVHSNPNDFNSNLRATSLTISGSRLKTIDASWHSTYMNSDKCATLDVSACPALVSLNAVREYKSYKGDVYCNLKKILLSSEQMSAYGSGQLVIEKNDSTSVEEKE